MDVVLVAMSTTPHQEVLVLIDLVLGAPGGSFLLGSPLLMDLQTRFGQLVLEQLATVLALHLAVDPVGPFLRGPLVLA